jgi:hypothetical protein
MLVVVDMDNHLEAKEMIHAPSPEILAYAAGVIDGDGCITCHYEKKRPGIITIDMVVNMVEKAPIQWLHTTFGGRCYQRTLPKPWRSVVIWELKGIPARNALLLLHPYLVLKQPQAQLAITLCDLITARGGTSIRLTTEEISDRERLYYAIRKLNRVGIHAATISSCVPQ